MDMGRRIALFIGLSLVLSGCITQQTDTRLRSNGSGTQAIRFGFSQQLLDLVNIGGQGSVNLEEALVELGTATEKLPADWAATSVPWESPDRQYKGTEVTLQFNNLATLEEQLSQGGLGAENSLLAFTDVRVREEDGAYVIRATIDASSTAANVDSQSQQALAALQGGTFGNNVPAATWRIEMPGPITEWSEQAIGKQEGNAVTYTFPFPPSRPYEIVVRGKVKPGIPLRVLLVVGGLLLAGLASILAGIVLNRRNRVGAHRAAATSRLTTTDAVPVAPQWGHPTPAPSKLQPDRASSPPAATPPLSYESPIMPTRPLGSWISGTSDPAVNSSNDQTQDNV